MSNKAIIVKNGIAQQAGATDKIDVQNIDVYNGVTRGLVPDAPDPVANKFLGADGNWSLINAANFGDVYSPASATTGHVVVFGADKQHIADGGALGNAAFKNSGTGSSDLATGDHNHDTAYHPLTTVLSTGNANILIGRGLGNTSTVAEITCTAAGRDLLDDANASAQRTTLGLGDSATKNVGTSVGDVADGGHNHNAAYQPLATVLTNTTASFTTALNTLLTAAGANTILGNATGAAGTVADITCTAAGRALLDDVDNAAQRTTLGLGDSATKNVGTTSGTVADGTHDHDARYPVLTGGKIDAGVLPASVVGALTYQTTWNGTVPDITSGPQKGQYWIVSADNTTALPDSGSTTIAEWKIGDWVIFDGTYWSKVDNTDSIISVNNVFPTNGNVTIAWTDISGSVPIAKIPTGTTGTTVSLGNHSHVLSDLSGDITYSQIDAIVGTGASNVAQGNHEHGIATGGTGATTLSGALTNLGQAFVMNAGETIVAGNLVCIYTGTIFKANNTTANGAKQAIGVALNGGSASDPITVALSGVLTTSTSGLTVGARCYLGANGAVSQTPTSVAGELMQFVGIATGDAQIVFINQDGIIM